MLFIESHNFFSQKLKILHVGKLQITFEWLLNTDYVRTLIIDFLHSFNGLSAGWASVSVGSQLGGTGPVKRETV